MGSNSAGGPEIAGSLPARIAKTLIYGKQRKSGTDLRIEKIKKALCDFANQVRSAQQWAGRYKERNSRKIGEIENSRKQSPLTTGGI